MRTIIFIGTQKSGSSREAIRAAQNLGYYTVLFTNNPKQLGQRYEYPDVHLMKYCNTDDIKEMSKIIDKLRKRGLKIKAIVSFVDSKCTIANTLAKEYGLNHFTCEAIYKMENKLLSRNSIKESIYSPKFITITKEKENIDTEVETLFPAIIKSPKSSGSKDVYKVSSIPEFKEKLNILNEKYPGQAFLLEEYLDGPQYITEVLVINEEVHIIAVIEQEISFINNHYIVTGYYLINEQIEGFDELKEAVTDIVRLHGLKQGACHLELRLVNGVWKLIEINPRISGGGMNQLIELGTGINLVEQTLKLVLNEEINIEPKFRKHVYMQHTTANEEGILLKVTGRNRARRSTHVLALYVKPRIGNRIMFPTSLGKRYAYVVATGNNKTESEEAAKKAIKEIKFHVTKIEKG